jgi:hypothetical protein
MKSRVDVEEVVDHVPRTELLVLDPSSRSAQQSQQRLHGVHKYGDETPGVNVLAPHTRQGRRPREGGRRLGRWRGSQVVSPLSPSLVYIGRTNGLLSHRPITNPNPSWAFKPYCDDGLLGISPTQKAPQEEPRATKMGTDQCRRRCRQSVVPPAAASSLSSST